MFYFSKEDLTQLGKGYLEQIEDERGNIPKISSLVFEYRYNYESDVRLVLNKSENGFSLRMNNKGVLIHSETIEVINESYDLPLLKSYVVDLF